MNCSSSLLRAAISWELTAGDRTSSSCSSFRRWAWWASCRSRALSQWARSRREVARSRTALSLSASCSSSQPSATRREQSPLVSMERLNSRRDCKRRAVQLRRPPQMAPGCVPAYPSFTHPSLTCPPPTCPSRYTMSLSTNLSHLPTHPPVHPCTQLSATACLSPIHLPSCPPHLSFPSLSIQLHAHPPTKCPSIQVSTHHLPAYLSPHLPVLPSIHLPTQYNLPTMLQASSAILRCHARDTVVSTKPAPPPVNIQLKETRTKLKSAISWKPKNQSTLGSHKKGSVTKGSS